MTECGAGFTHNLEQMFKDIELAREENSSYKSLLEESQTHPAVDLNVNVLSASAWPSYPDISLEIPRGIQTLIAGFEKFYKLKHSGRRLTWKHALAHCQLKARFPRGDKEIVVSSFQAIVLLLFNRSRASENMSYSEIQGATNPGKCHGAAAPFAFPVLIDYFQRKESSNERYNHLPVLNIEY